jgi:hypothetical protein
MSKVKLFRRLWFTGDDAFVLAGSVAAAATRPLVIGHNPTNGRLPRALLWTRFDTPATLASFLGDVYETLRDDSPPTFSEAPLAEAPSRVAFLLDEEPLLRHDLPDSVRRLFNQDEGQELDHLGRQATLVTIATTVLLELHSHLGSTATPPTLANCAISFAETAQLGRQFRILLPPTCPVLAGQVHRDAFLAKAMSSKETKRLVADGVVTLEHYYKYSIYSGVPLLFCPAEIGHAERRSTVFRPMPPSELGLGGEAVASESVWSEVLLHHHCFTCVAPEAPRASLDNIPTSAADLIGTLGDASLVESALALYDMAKHIRATPISLDDLKAVLTTPTGFELTFTPAVEFRCVAGARHGAGVSFALKVDAGCLTVMCRGGPRHGATALDIPLAPKKGVPAGVCVSRTGHVGCCCRAVLGHVPRPAFIGKQPILRAPKVVDGVAYEASLKKAARSPHSSSDGRERSVTVTCSPCSMGKTFAYSDAIIEHVRDEARAQRGSWVVVVCSHVILVDAIVAELSAKLEAAGIEKAKNYADFEENRSELWSGVVVVCAPSVHHVIPGIRRLDAKKRRLMVVCDELVAALNMIPTLRSKNRLEPDELLQTLGELFVNADVLIVCDANADHANVGRFFKECGIQRYQFVKTNALPFRGQVARLLIPVEVHNNDQFHLQPWYAAVVLNELITQAGAPSVFVPVSTKKCGQVLFTWCTQAHPGVEVRCPACDAWSGLRPAHSKHGEREGGSPPSPSCSGRARRSQIVSCC